MALLALVQAYQPAVLEWVRSDPARMRARAQLLLGITTLIVLAPVAGFAVYIWRLGTRTLREERFPPEGVTVVRDVVVVRGADARARGRLLRTFAGILGALTVVLLLIAYWLVTVTPASR